MTPSLLRRRDVLRSLAAGALLPALGATTRPARAAPAAPSADAPLPSDSLWQLPIELTDQDGHPFQLASLRGTPVLASMFYANCEMVCPLIFETVLQTLRDAGPAVEARARVLMVSFDPARDTVAVLKQTAQDHHAGPRWTLARGTDDAARQFAAVLGVQFKQLPSGAFNHSASIALLDTQGRIVERSALLGQVDPLLRDKLKALAA